MKSGKLHAVVVDDDKDDLFFISEALKNSGGFSDIEDFTAGAKALSYLRDAADTPDVIITDLKMPLMSGIELLSQIKAIDKITTVPVILFSTSSSPLDIANAERLGATGYITKPFNLSGFDGVAAAILGRLSPSGGVQSSNDPAVKWFA